MKKSDAYMAIRSHIVDGTPLPSHHERIFERWKRAFSLLCKYNLKGIAVEYLMAEFEISQAQAYRDVGAAEEIWGNVRKYAKDFLRTFLIESAIEDMNAYKKIAMKIIQKPEGEEPSSADWKIYSLNMTLREEARKSAIKAGGVDKDDIETPDFSQIQMPEIVINLQQEQMDMLRRILESGAVDLSKLVAVKKELDNGQFEEAIMDDKKEAG